MHIPYSDFHSNQTISVESKDINQFTSLNKVGFQFTVFQETHQHTVNVPGLLPHEIISTAVA